MTQSIDEQIGTLPTIESEAHFFQIGSEMLGTNLVPRPGYSALKQRERGFDSVCVGVAHNIDAFAVSDGFVILDASFADGDRVSRRIIGKNHFHVLGDVLSDVLSESTRLGVMRMEESEIAVALANADYHFLVVHASDAAFALVHAADVCSIHFDFAVHHGFIGLRHRVPDSVAEIPCCFVAHANSALNLAGGHSLFCFAEEVRGKKPFAKREMRVIENRPRGDGELVIAIFAVEELFIGIQLDHWSFAAQALRAFWEAETDQKLAALIFSTKQGVYVH
jgi:hypothetical protein